MKKIIFLMFIALLVFISGMGIYFRVKVAQRESKATTITATAVDTAKITPPISTLPPDNPINGVLPGPLIAPPDTTK